MVELVFAIFVGSILTSIALTSVQNLTARFSARAARDVFVSLHARARVRAIERGQPAVLYMDPANDSASVVQAGTVVETIHFRPEYNVDFQGPGGALELCMSPRGIADGSCTNFSTVQTVEFHFNSDVRDVRILPLGQLLY